MRNINQLAAVGVAGAALFAGPAEAAPVLCDISAQQQVINTRLRDGTDLHNWVLEAHNPDITTVHVSETGQPAWRGIDNPLVVECGKRVVAYVGRESFDSTELLPAAKAQVSEYVGLRKIPVKNPRGAGLLVRRTLHRQFDPVYGSIGFSDGKVTFGLMPLVRSLP